MQTDEAALRQVTLAVLAGGGGTRMGQPKGLLRIDDRPVLDWLLDRFAWPGPKWLITAPGREHPPRSDRFDCEWIDPVADAGPLRGVLTALEHLQTPMLVLATVDMPGISGEHLRWIAARLADRPQTLGLMFRRRADNLHIIEPFPLALRKGAVHFIRRRLEAGLHSMHKLLEEPAVVEVAPPDDWDAQAWTNLNQPADLERFVAARRTR